MKRRIGYGIVWIALLLPILAVAGCGKAQPVAKEAEITVNTAPAQVQDLTQSVSYSGIVRGKNEVYLLPKVAARVTSIPVKAGDQVKVGQTLIILDNSNFTAGVQQAQAGLAMAQAGQRANDMQVESAQSDYSRAQALHTAGAISDQQLELARLKYASLTAGSAEAAVAQAQAALAAAQTLVNYCVITSPIDGVVGSIGLSPGDNANPAAVAAIVSDNGQLQVKVMVSETEVSYIQPGSPVKVLISAVQEQAFTGTVANVAGAADPATHNYAVQVDLPNPDGRIKSGMFAELGINTMSKQGILAIPVGAVIPRGGREIVFVVDQDKRARETEVTTGIKNDKYIEILSGLQTGQAVIINGNTLVSDGSLVKVVTGGAQ